MEHVKKNNKVQLIDQRKKSILGEREVSSEG